MLKVRTKQASIEVGLSSKRTAQLTGKIKDFIMSVFHNEYLVFINGENQTLTCLSMFIGTG